MYERLSEEQKDTLFKEHLAFSYAFLGLANFFPSELQHLILQNKNRSFFKPLNSITGKQDELAASPSSEVGPLPETTLTDSITTNINYIANTTTEITPAVVSSSVKPLENIEEEHRTEVLSHPAQRSIFKPPTREYGKNRACIKELLSGIQANSGDSDGINAAEKPIAQLKGASRTFKDSSAEFDNIDYITFHQGWLNKIINKYPEATTIIFNDNLKNNPKLK